MSDLSKCPNGHDLKQWVTTAGTKVTYCPVCGSKYGPSPASESLTRDMLSDGATRISNDSSEVEVAARLAGWDAVADALGTRLPKWPGAPSKDIPSGPLYEETERLRREREQQFDEARKLARAQLDLTTEAMSAARYKDATKLLEVIERARSQLGDKYTMWRTQLGEWLKVQEISR